MWSTFGTTTCMSCTNDCMTSVADQPHLEHAHSLSIRRMASIARVAHVLPGVELQHKTRVGLHSGTLALYHTQHVVSTGAAQPHEVCYDDLWARESVLVVPGGVPHRCAS